MMETVNRVIGIGAAKTSSQTVVPDRQLLCNELDITLKNRKKFLLPKTRPLVDFNDMLNTVLSDFLAWIS